MFTRQVLEQLDDVLNGREITDSERAGLQRTITSALWAESRHLSKREREAVASAERQGKVQVCGQWESSLDPVTGERKLVPARVEPKPSRLKPAVATAKDGDELLGLLGL